jgi:diguanylate cyclase (GGDEF)-like protein
MHTKNRAKTTRYLRIISYVFLSCLLFILLPVFLTVRQAHPPVRQLLLFYAASILIVIYSLRKNQKRIYNLKLQTQDLYEKINILEDQNSHELKNKIALEEKIRRYDGLKNIIENINQNLALESIADNLASIAFSLIGKNKGLCVLYLVDNQTQKLNLFKAKKEDKTLIIKAKEGDIFDLWVLRHSSPLIIEDIKKDFRFDLDKLKGQDIRNVSSLVSAPFISEHRLLGILRLDYTGPNFYSQDDLRFLVTICELGAVALENGELFQKTQDLAIHDELTSLFTKGYFLERLREEYKRSIRQDRVFSLLMLDIDYFKKYNDRFGHTAGDIVLKALSDSICEGLKDLSPIVSRFGGEEFCVILPGLDKKGAYKIAEDIRRRIEKATVILRRQQTTVSVSIGVASFPDDAKDEDALILKADKAMYKAKQEGRNRVVVSD